MGKITLSNIRMYAHHGCLQEESIVGSEYRVDVSVMANLQLPASSDILEDTVDYVLINKIVKSEMKKSSKLLEHVAHRIIRRIFSETPMVNEIDVSVSKINPPIGGDVEMVTVTMSEKR